MFEVEILRAWLARNGEHPGAEGPAARGANRWPALQDGYKSRYRLSRVRTEPTLSIREILGTIFLKLDLELLFHRAPFRPKLAVANKDGAAERLANVPVGDQ